MELWHLDLRHDPSEFFKHQLDALEGRGLKSEDLLFGQDLKGDFWDEQIRTQRASISNGCLYIIICKCVKRVYVADGDSEVLIEDVIKSAAALQLDSGVFHKPAFEELGVSSRILSDDVKD